MDLVPQNVLYFLAMNLQRVTKRYFANPFLNNISAGATPVTDEWINTQITILINKVTRRKFVDEEISDCMVHLHRKLYDWVLRFFERIIF